MNKGEDEGEAHAVHKLKRIYIIISFKYIKKCKFFFKGTSIF